MVQNSFEPIELGDSAVEFEPEAGLGVPESDEIDVTPPGSTSPYSPEVTDSVATLATLAQIDTSNPGQSVTEFQTAVGENRAAIEAGSEAAIRMQILNQEAAAESARLREMLISDAGTQGANIQQLQDMVDTFATIDEQAKNKDKLEETALDRIQDFALSHPEQGDLLELMAADEIEERTVIGSLRDQLERSIILRREADKASKVVKNQSLGADVVDILARMIPFNKLTSVDNIVESSMLDLSGTKILLARQNLFSVSRAEFDEKLPKMIEAIKNESAWIGQNAQLIRENIHELGSANTKTETLHNFFDFIDFTVVVPVMKVVPALSKATVAKFARNRDLGRVITESSLKLEQDDVIFVNAQGQAAIGKQGGIEEAVVAMAIDESMPTALKTTEQLVDGSVGLSDSVGRGLDANAQAAEAVTRALEITPRLTEEELAEAFEGARAAAIETHGEGAVIDFQVVPVPVGRGGTIIDKYTMVIGRKDGVGYATKSSATKAANLKGMLDFDIIQDADGLHFINVTSDIKEAGYIHTLNVEGTTPTLFINTFFRSPAAFLPDILQSRAASSVFAKGRVQKLLAPMVNNLKGLGRKSRARVSAVLKRGNIEKKWYTLNEFMSNFSDLHAGRMPTNREVLAYYTVKDINDFDFILRNHAEYVKRVSDGFVTGEVQSANGFKLRAGNMKEIERIDDVGRAIIFDVSEGKLIEGRKIGVDVLVERMKKEGLRLFRVEGDDIAFKGRPLNHILVRKGDLKLKDLEYRQLKYSAGGHRLYDGKYFVKQIVRGSTESGAKFVKNPRTHVVAPTKGTATEWMDRMNGARDAFRKAQDDPSFTLQADRIIRDAGIEDGTEGWAKLLDDGKLQDEPFQVVFDRDLPKGHQEILREDGTYDLTFEATGQRAYLEQQGQLYYSRKGNILKGPQDETAGLIDPFISATRAVENAASIASFTNYRLNGIQRWMKTYGKLLPPNEGVSPLQQFWTPGELVRGSADANVLARAQSIRLAIQRQLGTHTKFGQAVRNGIRNLADWIEGPGVGGARSKVAKKLLDKMDTDPVGAIKGFSFDLKLGMFDPSQLIIQTQTIASLVALNPIRFPKFMWDGVLMRYAAVNTSPEMLAWAAKRSSMKVDEFTQMVKTMRESGITDINGELIVLDHSVTAALGPVGSTIQRTRDMGRIPFFEAERLNRIYAWRKSWDDMRAEGLSVSDMKKPDGRVELKRRTDKFTMNMTSASAAWWQKGALSIPTQFLAYQARLFENVLPIIGNKQWTASEKARLFLGQVLLYGAVGVPSGRYILDNIFKHTGKEFDPDSFADQVAYRAYIGGFMDSMLYAVTNGELDVAFSQRAAVGQAVTDFMQKISGGGFETQSFLEVIGGAPFSVIGDVGSDAIDVVKAIARAAASESVSVTEILPSLVTQMAVNASSLSRAHRAYYVWKYGEWISQESGKVLAKATKTETIAAAFGFTLRELGDFGFVNTLTKGRQEFIKSQAKLISKLQLEAARLWNNDDKEGWDLKQREITAWMQVLDPPLRNDIIKAARLSSDWRTTMEIMGDNFNQKFAPTTGSPQLPAENTER